MGTNNSSINELVQGYIDPIPVLPEDVNDGKKTTEYFKNKHKFTDVSLFSKEKLNRKNEQVASTGGQKNYLDFLSNLVNIKAQKNFQENQLK